MDITYHCGKDHPRVCGNHSERPRPRTAQLGSPPRVREPLLPLWPVAHRIRDNPRVCGNPLCVARFAAPLTGSPPRVREPPYSEVVDDMIPRITPACAGTTVQGVHDVRHGQDHPRVCGNHLLCFTMRIKRLGSPPRVRKPLNENTVLSYSDRITPACSRTTQQPRPDAQ